MADTALAIDIGGTKVAAGIVDSDGVIRASSVLPTGAQEDGEVLFQRLAGMVATVLAAATGGEPVVCGVGCGGPMTLGGEVVSPINIPAWRPGFALHSRLAALTGLPTYIDNDAKALALAEGWCGAARGRANYLAMVVSTGIGGGLVLDGRLLDGVAGNAGHIGHLMVEPAGRTCGCGARGCLEAEASGSAIAAITGRSATRATSDVVARTGMLVGRAIAGVSNLLDLDLAVIGGSVALGFGDPFLTAARLELGQRARLQHSRATVIELAGLGPDGPLIGAAAVGWRAVGRFSGPA